MPLFSTLCLAPMEFRLLPAAFALLGLLATSNASSHAEEYWQSVLPYTPMPKALQDLLKPALPFQADAGNGSHTDDIGLFNNYHFDYNLVGAPRLPVQKHDFSNTTIFFPYNDLHRNTKMIPLFAKSSNKARFLPREVAQSIPFSIDKLPEIFNHFSISDKSLEAQIIRNTIEECEGPSIKGEDKYCATSLESLLDFNVAKLGKNVEMISTEQQQESKRQEYEISPMGVKMIGDNVVICHKQKYPYAVFYCHAINATEVHMVPLVGADGTKTKAVVICHMDTSAWSPDHFVFQVLKLKPGPPICHFPDGNTFVWISNQ